MTLDPVIAHPELTLSEDRRQVTRGWPQENLATSPRRFSALPCVLGCESFDSGKHFFEVDVGEGTGWDLGVCMESVQRGTQGVSGRDASSHLVKLLTCPVWKALSLADNVCYITSRTVKEER